MRIKDTRWKAWLLLALVMTIIAFSAGLSQMIREGTFGDGLIWFAGWVTPLTCAVGLIIMFIFRKKLVEWNRIPSTDDGDD